MNNKDQTIRVNNINNDNYEIIIIINVINVELISLPFHLQRQQAP